MNENKAKHSDNNNNKSRKYILMILEILFCSIAIFSLIKIIIWVKDNKANEEILEDISSSISVQVIEDEEDEKTEQKLIIDFEKLKSVNSDIVSYIKIENTNIEYPIVKSKDNDYYLNHSFDKKNNSAGWIFMDYRNKADGTDKNIVLYGHNRKDTSMFGTLRYVFDKEWYENQENLYITYITENEYAKYQIFSAYRIEVEDYYITTNFKSDNEFKQFVNKVKSRSFRNFGVDVAEKDQVLTLSTCSNNGYRVAVHAKKIID